MATPRDVPRDDDLDELPPLDGDARDRDPEPDFSDLIDERGEASRDDVTGEDDPVDPGEIETGGDGEGGWLDGSADATDLDLGSAELIEQVDEESLLEGSEDPGVGDEDFGVATGAERGDLDAGEEGPLAKDEELRDEDLPALDADEQGEPDDAAFVDAGFGADEPPAVAWAAQPWPLVGAPLVVGPATAVACAVRGAIAAVRGDADAPAEIVRVDLEGACDRVAAEGLPAGEVSAIDVDGDRVALVAGGRRFVSHDAGARFVADAASKEPGSSPRTASRAGHAARIDAHGGLSRRLAGGASDNDARTEGHVTAIAFVDDAGTLVAAAWSESDDATSLVRVDADGAAAVVARVDGRVAALACDDARGVVWVAGTSGLAAFEVR